MPYTNLNCKHMSAYDQCMKFRSFKNGSCHLIWPYTKLSDIFANGFVIPVILSLHQAREVLSVSECYQKEVHQGEECCASVSNKTPAHINNTIMWTNISFFLITL